MPQPFVKLNRPDLAILDSLLAEMPDLSQPEKAVHEKIKTILQLMKLKETASRESN